MSTRRCTVRPPKPPLIEMKIIDFCTGLVHAQHHRIYVSYAYGAVYAHWLETLFLDILSFVLAGEIAQLSARQSMLFGSFATIKTICDHCGYVFPWDPFRLVNNNGAVFHDLHHQNWGLKVCSAQLSLLQNVIQSSGSCRPYADNGYSIISLPTPSSGIISWEPLGPIKLVQRHGISVCMR